MARKTKARTYCKVCESLIDYSKSNIPKEYCKRACVNKDKARKNAGGNTEDYLTDADYLRAQENGISRAVLYSRFNIYGWDKERAISQSVGNYGSKKKKAKEEIKIKKNAKLTLAEIETIARERGMTYGQIVSEGF